MGRLRRVDYPSYLREPKNYHLLNKSGFILGRVRQKPVTGKRRVCVGGAYCLLILVIWQIFLPAALTCALKNVRFFKKGLDNFAAFKLRTRKFRALF